MRTFIKKSVTSLIVASLFSGSLFANIAVAELLPDLTVEKVVFSKTNPAVNEEITISATIKNIGSAGTGGFMVLVASEGGDKSGGIVNSLAAGSSTVIHMKASWQTVGLHDVYTMADFDGWSSYVPESNEDNNYIKSQLNIVGQSTQPSILSTALSLKASPKTITAGKIATITGKLKDKNGNPVANKTVTIKANGKAVKRIKTNSGGKFQFKHKPKKTTIYQASFNGDSGYSSTSSNKSKVTVKKPKAKKKNK